MSENGLIFNLNCKTYTMHKKCIRCCSLLHWIQTMVKQNAMAANKTNKEENKRRYIEIGTSGMFWFPT